MSTLPRIYTLGNSPMSYYFAYELSQIKLQPTIPNIVLLLNDQKKLNRFLDNDSTLTPSISSTTGKVGPARQFMAACSPPTYATGKSAIIDNLIVSEPNIKTLSHLLEKYSCSLQDTTNVLLVDPPIGSLKYLYNNIWNKEERTLRPNLFVGMTKNYENKFVGKTDVRNSTGISNEFKVNMNLVSKKIDLLVSPIPKQLDSFESGLYGKEVSNPLINTVQETDNISVSMLDYWEFLFVRYEKLIIDSCIKPLAALYDCKYINELLLLDKAKVMIRFLIKEQVKILKHAFPFMLKIPNQDIAFDDQRLYNVILNKIEKSTKIKSSLSMQVRDLNLTDINQLTGYFVRLAYDAKVDCRWNETVTWLLKGKLNLEKHRDLNYHYL